MLLMGSTSRAKRRSIGRNQAHKREDGRHHEIAFWIGSAEGDVDGGLSPACAGGAEMVSYGNGNGDE